MCGSDGVFVACQFEIEFGYGGVGGGLCLEGYAHPKTHVSLINRHRRPLQLLLLLQKGGFSFSQLQRVWHTESQQNVREVHKPRANRI
jgi:hypothetical protein